MFFIINNRIFRDFVEGTISMRLDALSRSYSFQAGGSGGVAALPFKTGDPILGFVDEALMVTGYIELITVDGDSGNYTITVAGRDKLGDLIDSSLGSLGDIAAPTTMKQVCEVVLEHLQGADTAAASTFSLEDETTVLLPPFPPAPRAGIQVWDYTQGRTFVPELPFNSNSDVLAPEPGTNAFEFLDKLARRHQVLLTSSNTSDLLIRGHRFQRRNTGAYVTHIFEDPNNNVLKYSMSYDTRGRFNLYKSETQGNPLALGGSVISGIDGIVHKEGSVTDEEIRLGRQLVIANEGSYNGLDNDNRILWEANVKRAKGRTYTATVSGFSDSEGVPWEVGTLVRVDDDFAGLHAVMLIDSVSFHFTEEDGRRTVLGLLEESAYALRLEKPVSDEEYAS